MEKDSIIARLENKVENLSDELNFIKNAENEQNVAAKINTKLKKSMVFMINKQDDIEANNLNMQNMIMQAKGKEEKLKCKICDQNKFLDEFHSIMHQFENSTLEITSQLDQIELRYSNIRSMHSKIVGKITDIDQGYRDFVEKHSNPDFKKKFELENYEQLSLIQIVNNIVKGCIRDQPVVIFLLPNHQ